MQRCGGAAWTLFKQLYAADVAQRFFLCSFSLAFILKTSTSYRFYLNDYNWLAAFLVPGIALLLNYVTYRYVNKRLRVARSGKFEPLNKNSCAAGCHRYMYSLISANLSPQNTPSLS